MRLALFLVLALPALAHAEAGLLSSRGRLDPRSRVELFGGPRSLGLGLTFTDLEQRAGAKEGAAHAGVGLEAAWFLFDRVAEVRVARVWQVTRSGVATLSVAVGGTGIVVPDAKFVLGAGPQAAVSLGLGGRHFQVDVAAQGGAELFIRAQTARFPLRLQVGVSVLPGDFSFSVLARTGVDLFSTAPLAIRGEVLLAVGWLGFT
jgi:hypothetical protein